MSLSPKSSDDLNGWTPLTCWQAEIVRRDDLMVASGRSDTTADHWFTEWWTRKTDRIAREVPVLREYRVPGKCSHYLAGLPSECANEEPDA